MSVKQFYGTSVAIEDRGLLIIGKSGSGKSDLALRLIDSGATLISDDQTVCKKVNKEIFLFSIEKICGLIEVRGIGIIKVPYVENVKLKMIIELTDAVTERMPEKINKKLFGVKVKYIKISGKEPSSVAKVKLKLFEEIT